MYRDIEQLANQFFEDPSVMNRRLLVLACVPLVRSIIARLRVPKQFLATFEDLQGVGLLGLMEVIERYDATRDNRFTSYAYTRIRGSMIDYLRMIDVLPRERREDLARAQKAVEYLGQQQGAEPGDQEVATFLGISLNDYHTLLRDNQLRHAVSLHDADDEGWTGRLLESIPNDDADLNFEKVDWDSEKAYVEELMRHLPEREQRIMAYYYEENLTLREIGTLLGVSEARISQIINRALRKIRSHIDTSRSAA